MPPCRGSSSATEAATTSRRLPLKARPAWTARLEDGCHDGREDGELVSGRRASRPRRAGAEEERARDHAARRAGKDGGARRATNAIFH